MQKISAFRGCVILYHKSMLETHPFGNFVPQKVRYLLLGSFTTKEANDKNFDYQWFYANKRNQFWPILTEVYNRDLTTLEAKKQLFVDIQTALADIIWSCERQSNSNLDMHLKNIVINPNLSSLIVANHIEKIFFTSRFVEKLFIKNFKYLISQYPNIGIITLPSPSPRYAAMSKIAKINKYKEVLPSLIS